MQKLDKIFITGLVTGLLSISAVLAINIQQAQAQIGTSHILDNAITSAEISDGAVNTTDLAKGAATKEKLASDSIKLVINKRVGTYEVLGANGRTSVQQSCNP